MRKISVTIESIWTSAAALQSLRHRPGRYSLEFDRERARGNFTNNSKSMAAGRTNINLPTDMDRDPNEPDRPFRPGGRPNVAGSDWSWRISAERADTASPPDSDTFGLADHNHANRPRTVLSSRGLSSRLGSDRRQIFCRVALHPAPISDRPSPPLRAMALRCSSSEASDCQDSSVSRLPACRMLSCSTDPDRNPSQGTPQFLIRD